MCIDDCPQTYTTAVVYSERETITRSLLTIHFGMLAPWIGIGMRIVPATKTSSPFRAVDMQDGWMVASGQGCEARPRKEVVTRPEG